MAGWTWLFEFQGICIHVHEPVTLLVSENVMPSKMLSKPLPQVGHAKVHKEGEDGILTLPEGREEFTQRYSILSEGHKQTNSQLKKEPAPYARWIHGEVYGGEQAVNASVRSHGVQTHLCYLASY